MDDLDFSIKESGVLKSYFLALVEMVKNLFSKDAISVVSVKMTYQWVKKKIKEKLAKKNVDKVAMVEKQKLFDEFPNQISLSDLESIGDYCIAEIDVNGEVVGDLEFVKDQNMELDREVDSLLKQERMVVVG